MPAAIVSGNSRKIDEGTSVAFDSKKQREILGKFATGVTIATTATSDQTWGMTANAVTSLSLDPPLVLLAIVKETQSHALFQSAGCFALNILTVEQVDLSNRFASAGPKDFAGIATRRAATGSPIIEGSLGWVDCRLQEILPGGDHDIFIGEILDGAVGDGEPLLFYAGRYGRLTPLEP